MDLKTHIRNMILEINNNNNNLISEEVIENTPERIETFYKEIFSGLLQNPYDFLKKTFPIKNNDLVLEKDISFYSMCEHHFLPFFGKISIGYIPNNKIVGFGDIVKVIEALAEAIAKEILIKYSLVQSVKVKIKKPWAPIKKHFDYVAVEITRSRNTAYLSIGTNIGSLKSNLETAISHIGNLENTRVTKISTFLETKPFGDVIQDNFLNACLEIETLFTPQELLKKLLDIEIMMGRVREIKWGPRIIDLDILLFNNLIVGEENLAIPHPWMCERSFVLDPLNEIAPNIIHPLENKSISTLKRILDKSL